MSGPGWLTDASQFVRERLGAMPDVWQEEALRIVSQPGRQRLVLKACAGPGKTSTLAWVILWYMLTQLDAQEQPNGICLSSSEDNLANNLWKELSKWLQRDPLLNEQFKMNSEKLYQVSNKQTWFTAARSFPQSANPQEAGESLSGLHGDYIIVALDEAGSLPPSLLGRAEQALATAKRGLIILAGNPTRRDSALYEADKNPHYQSISITSDPDDPKRTPRVPAQWAAEQIKTHGRNDPWVRSYILGEFPDKDFQGLLSEGDVERAQLRSAPPDDLTSYERRIGLDVARYGDDRTVLFPRQGRQAYQPVELRSQSGPQVVRRLAAALDRWTPSGPLPVTYVDDTGGYGGSVVDHAELERIPVVPINVSEQPDDPDRYFNRRAELYARAAAWVKSGGCLPTLPGLAEEAAATQFSYIGSRMKLEPKDAVKKRIGRSPDLWDAFCLTFAEKERSIRDGGSRALVTACDLPRRPGDSVSPFQQVPSWPYSQPSQPQ